MKEDKYKHEQDAFSERIRQKLENHTMPVGADVWKKIEKRMAPSRRVVPAWLYTTVAVAAGLALLFSVGNFFYFRDELIPASEEIVQHQDEIQQFMVVPEQSVQQKSNPVRSTGVGTQLLVDAHNKQNNESKEILSPVNDEVVEKVEAEIEITTVPETSKKEIAEVKAASEKTEVKADPEKQKQTNKLTLPVEKQTDWTTLRSKKKREPMMLAAALGSGIASSSATITGRSRAYRAENLVNLSTNMSNVLTPNDFRHKEYMPPFSVGLNVRMPLNERFAVESGLVYTYLLTRLSGSTSGDYRADVNLHYLGVPANVVLSMLKERKWEIYLSAGGMIEKGVRTDFRQYQNWDDVEVTTEANTDVDGVQWSLNTTLGVGYLLQKNISLFFDPKLSYYFDNDQPFSIRKEMPLLVSLNTGLRMSF
ncbi:MAG: porin family protein [Paludibacter sp.]|nr:porin family protein [Paludibacter sp.]MDD4198424.1 porin family protein [Paludibacter sp.]MDD4427136.1 porin family protein [Paludibacter sp.]